MSAVGAIVSILGLLAAIGAILALAAFAEEWLGLRATAAPDLATTSLT